MIKKILLNSCKYLGVAGACLFFAPAVSFSAEYVSVIKDGVNVRTGPGTNSPVFMELFQDYPLQVVEKRGEWLKIIDYEKDGGWIYAPLTSQKKTVIVASSSRVNMRSGPSTKDDKVASIEPGVVLSVIEEKGDWLHVKHDLGQGWIYGKLLWP